MSQEENVLSNEGSLSLLALTMISQLISFLPITGKALSFHCLLPTRGEK